METTPGETPDTHPAQPISVDWITARLAALPGLRPGRLLLPRAEIEEAWRSHLDDRVAAQKEATPENRKVPDGLGQETSNNYARQVRKFLDAMSGSPPDEETLKLWLAGNPVEMAAEYFDGISAQNAATGRTVRSAVVGQFLPWAVESNAIELDLTPFSGLIPLPFRKFSLPVVEYWLAEDFPNTDGSQEGAIAQYRMEMRSFVRFASCEKMGDREGDFKADSRELLEREKLGERRVAEQAKQWRDGDSKTDASIPDAPYESTVEYMLYDSSCVAEYARELATNRRTRDSVKHHLSRVRRFYAWAHEQGISPIKAADIINPANVTDSKEAHKTPASNARAGKAKVKRSGRKTSAGKVEANEPEIKLSRPDWLKTTKTVWTPPERRLELSTPFRSKLEIRNGIASELVEREYLSFPELVDLALQEISIENARVVLQPGKKEKKILDSEMSDRFMEYGLHRSRANFRTSISARGAPFFLSADGGGLIVGLPGGGKQERQEYEGIVRAQKWLIDILIREEKADFGDLPEMETTTLQSLPFQHSETPSKVSQYLQLMRVSSLGSACTSPHGPGLAFPGGDGWHLTGDTQ